MACKETYNGVFLHPWPVPHNWLNAKEVMYFKEIIKGVKDFTLESPGHNAVEISFENKVLTEWLTGLHADLESKV